MELIFSLTYNTFIFVLVVAPKITEVEKVVVLKTGQQVETTIEFEAYPEPTAVVTFNGTTPTVPHTATVSDSKCIFKMADVTRQDHSGVFNVKLANPYGEDNVDIQFNINGMIHYVY